MFKGDIYVQPWAPHSSTESRLICAADNEMIEYVNLDYEEKFFYHNDVVRVQQKFLNPIKGEGLKNDYDSCSDVIQIYDYLTTVNLEWKKNLPLSERIRYIFINI